MRAGINHPCILFKLVLLNNSKMKHRRFILIIFSVFLKLPQILSQSLSFASDTNTFAWNEASGEINLTLDRGIDLVNVAVTVTCEIARDHEDDARFGFTVDGDFGIADLSKTLSFSWGDTATSYPGGYAVVTCTPNPGSALTAVSTSVQILFPPKLSIYPPLLYLPRDAIPGTVFGLRVGLSEVPIEDTRITCSVVTAGTLDFTFTTPAVATPENALTSFISVPLTLRAGFAISQTETTVSCSAKSNSSFQYVESTSISNTATIQVQDIRVEISPESQVLKKKKTFFSLLSDQPHNTDLIFTCKVFSNSENQPNNTLTWLETAQNGGTCDMSIVDNLLRNISWVLSTEEVKISRGTKIAFFSLFNEGVFIEDELLTVLCCGFGDATSGVTLTATVIPKYSEKIIGQTASEILATPLPNPKWVNPAGCQCDLTFDKCDVNCCCDTTDCSQESIQVFNCIPGLQGGFTQNIDERNCDNSEDENPFLCVESNATSWLGYYFPDTSDKTLSSSDFPPVDFYQSSNSQLPVASSFVRGNYLTDGTTNLLYFPSQILGQMCVSKGYIQTLVDNSFGCSISNTQKACTDPDSILNARNYLITSSRTFPRPLESYFEFSFLDGNISDVAEGTSAYHCARTQEELDAFVSDHSNLPGACWFSDQNVLPPEPKYDTATLQCSNVVVFAEYKFNWKASRITSYEATYVLTTIEVSADNYQPPPAYSYLQSVEAITSSFTDSQPSVLTSGDPQYSAIIERTEIDSTVTSAKVQVFSVMFPYDSSIVDGSVVNIDQRSGNPGYIRGLPLRTATLDSEDSDVLTIAPEALTFPLPDTNGLCNDKKKTSLLFSKNFTTFCFVQLTFDDFKDCSGVAQKIKDVLNGSLSSIDSVYIGRRGNSDPENADEWVRFMSNVAESNSTGDWGSLAENTRDVLQTEPETESSSNFSDVDLYFNREALCRNIPTAYSFEFLVSDGAFLNGVVQKEIVAGMLRESYSSIELDCFRLNQPNMCEDSSIETQSFMISLTAKYFEFPNRAANERRKSKSEIMREERENCDTNDVCWSNIFYPLRKPANEDRQKYLIYQENIFFTGSIAVIVIFLGRFSIYWTNPRQR